MAELLIDVNTRGAHKVKALDKDLKKVEGTAKTTSRSLTAMGVALTAILVTKKVIDYADSWKLVEARLGLVTTGTKNLLAVEQALFKASQNTRQSYEATANLYTRMARASKSLGTSQTELLIATTAINKALIVSGASTQESNSAITQLSQGLASGVLRGEEFNSIMENGSRIAEALADSLGLSLGELRAWSKEGKLTANVVMEALISQAEKIGSEFEKMPMTVAQSMTVMDNNFTKAIGQLDKVTSGTEGLGNAIVTVSELGVDAIEFLGKAFIGLNSNIEVAGTAVADIVLWLTEWGGDYQSMSDSLWKTTRKNLDANQKLYDSYTEVGGAVSDLKAEQEKKVAIDEKAIKLANKLADAQQKILNQVIASTGSDYDIWLNNVNNLLTDMSKTGANVADIMAIYNGELAKYNKLISDSATEERLALQKEQIDIQDKLNDQMVELNDQLIASIGTEYEQWLNGVNNQMISLANNGASASQMMSVFNAEASKYTNAQQQSVYKQTLSSTGTEAEKFYDRIGTAIAQMGNNGATPQQQQDVYNAELTKFNKSQQDNSRKTTDNSKAINDNTRALNTRQSSSSGAEREQLSYREAYKILEKTTQATIGVRMKLNEFGGSGFSSGYIKSQLATSKRNRIENILESRGFKRTKVTVSGIDPAIKQKELRLQEEAAAKASKDAAEALERTISLFTNAFSDVISELGNVSELFGENISSRASSVLFGSSSSTSSFGSALTDAQSAMGALSGDLGNKEFATAYQRSIDALISSLDEFNDTSKFISREEQQFAKISAFNQTKKLETIALKEKVVVDENIQLLRDIRAAVNGEQPDSALQAVKDAVYVTIGNDNINAMSNDQILTMVAGNIQDTDKTLGGTGLSSSVKGLLASVDNKTKLLKSSTNEFIYTSKLTYSDSTGVREYENLPYQQNQSFQYYAKGGFTGNGSGQQDSSGFKQAGVVHEDEWVAPKWMIQNNPQMFQALENARNKGGFAVGGYAPSSSIPSNSSNSEQTKTNQFLFVVIDELKKQNSLLSTVTNGGDAMLVELIA